jgi:hypothetical protein
LIAGYDWLVRLSDFAILFCACGLDSLAENHTDNAFTFSLLSRLPAISDIPYLCLLGISSSPGKNAGSGNNLQNPPG